MKLSRIFILLLSFCFFYSLGAGESGQMKCSTWKLNTSNPGKFEEFKRLFAKHGSTLETSHIDLKEIDADPIKVVAHKASQLGENIIVEDTSLDIEGASVGVNIRWLLDHLTEYAGRKAEWTVLLAFRQDNQIYIYKGSISGTIVQPRGATGFGFDPVFLPNGSTETLAESKPDLFNARAKAVESLLKGDIWTKHPIIEKWEGPWQKNDH
jgi:XTP/dITP diphosphohydrolase